MNDAPNIKLLVDAREAARMLAISERTLWSWSAPRGSIPVVRLLGSRSVRYSVAALERWIKQQQIIGTQKEELRFFVGFRCSVPTDLLCDLFQFAVTCIRVSSILTW